MPPFDLTEGERAELIDLLVGTSESAHFPLSARIQRLRRILGKLRTASAKPPWASEMQMEQAAERGAAPKR